MFVNFKCFVDWVRFSAAGHATTVPTTPRRNKNAGLRKLRAITTAKTGAARWAARARQAVARRGVPTMPSPRRYSYNNVMILLPSGRAVPPNTYYKWEEYQRLLKRGYSNNAARAASGY